MVQAGAEPLTTIAYVSELQRDWARPTADDVAKLFAAACPLDPPNANPVATKVVLTSATTARLARISSIVDDGRIRRMLADDLQGE
jgi:hypothetical protein